MGDTEENGGGSSSKINFPVYDDSPRTFKDPVKRARALVLLIPLAIAIIVGGVALANSNIFQSFQPKPDTAQGAATTEAALARDIEREADVLDVIELVIEDGTLYVWIVDLQSGERWSDRDANAVTRAFDVLFEYAKSQSLGVEITFFAIVQIMGTEGVPVDVFQGAVQFICSADLIAEYGIGGGDSDNVLNQCSLRPDGMFISPDAEVPFIGR